MHPVKWAVAALVSAAVAALAFFSFGWLDLTVTGWFYDPARGFWLSDTWPAMAVYFGVRILMWIFGIALVGGLIWAHVSDGARAKKSRRPLWFLLLVLALGPGLITHTLFKDQWGRPRPEAIAPFGGQGHYVLPGVISDQCATNCSFTSGHAAAAFYLIAFGWVFPKQRRRWMWAGIIAGSVAGLVRIIQGGHFVTDIFFSYWVVWLTAASLARILKLKKPLPA